MTSQLHDALSGAQPRVRKRLDPLDPTQLAEKIDDAARLAGIDELVVEGWDAQGPVLAGRRHGTPIRLVVDGTRRDGLAGDFGEMEGPAARPTWGGDRRLVGEQLAEGVLLFDLAGLSPLGTGTSDLARAATLLCSPNWQRSAPGSTDLVELIELVAFERLVPSLRRARREELRRGFDRLVELTRRSGWTLLHGQLGREQLFTSGDGEDAELLVTGSLELAGSVVFDAASLAWSFVAAGELSLDEALGVVASVTKLNPIKLGIWAEAMSVLWASGPKSFELAEEIFAKSLVDDEDAG